MTKAELNDAFWNDVETTANGFGLGIGPDCASVIRGFIATGVDRLEQEELLNSASSITVAQTHLIAFVGGIAHEAKTKNLPMLREFTFEAARSLFCPLWPFC
jgi:hypothetical protein